MKNLYLLPTDKDSNLFIGDLSNQLHFNYSIEKGNSINQHIYITNSQEIKKGNWYLEEKSKFNPRKLISEEWGDGQHFKTFNQKGFRKIILTTDQDLIKDGVQAIDDEFLEWFVKNPSCEEVNIDSKLIVTQTKPLIQHQGSKPIVVPHKIKYKIIIPKKEPCTCKKHDPYCCHIHGSCPTCVKKEEPKQETLEEAAEYKSQLFEK